jgi:alkyldihydroxyacetonephosphate synthase
VEPEPGVRGGVRFSDAPLDRLAASRDLWPGGTLRAWRGQRGTSPARVWWPETEEQVLEVLEEAHRRRIPVVPYGAGSGVCGGAAGVDGAWVIDTKALARIGPLDADRWTVRVQAGVNGQQLEDWLAARGFTLGHSPSSISCSTVGGWAAARSAGQFSSKYGVFEDMVLGLRAVTPGSSSGGPTPGRGIVAVGEGEDAPAEWMDWLLGSEGTLGVVTELTLRVQPAPASRWLRGYRMSGVPEALEAMRGLMQGELHPAVVRLYDPVDTRIGGRTKHTTADAGEGGADDGADAPSFVRRWLERVDAMPAVHRRTLALPLALPGLLNRVLDRLASGCLLVVGWEGDPEVVEAQVAAGRAILDAAGEDLGPAPGERWFRARHDVSYKLMPVFERGGFADTMEVAARWSDLVPTYRAVRRALSPTTVVMAHMSHLYPEGGCIYFSFAGRGRPEVYERTWAAALEAVLASGATVTHHHGVGALKAEAASREVGAGIEVWRAAKAELDPNGILNPGRLFVDLPEPVDSGAPALLAPRPGDGLGRAPVEAEVARREAEGEPMWPFERLPGPPRWHRSPWQTPWMEVAGTVEGRRFLLGRGPRSASGPDVRAAMAERSADAEATFAVAPPGDRWMGEGRPPSPWRVALALLRSDLRPAVLTVRDGALRVGFRGPAAAALGRIASSRVPGGLEPVAYEPAPLPCGPLERADPDDPAVVTVTPQGALRRSPR